MGTVILFVWHAFEWVALIGGLVIASWAMSYNIRIGRIGPSQPILTSQVGADKDFADADRLADSLIFGALFTWRVTRRMLWISLRAVELVFTALTWPLTRVVRALDARDWQLRRRGPER